MKNLDINQINSVLLDIQVYNPTKNSLRSEIIKMRDNALNLSKKNMLSEILNELVELSNEKIVFNKNSIMNGRVNFEYYHDIPEEYIHNKHALEDYVNSAKKISLSDIVNDPSLHVDKNSYFNVIYEVFTFYTAEIIDD